MVARAAAEPQGRPNKFTDVGVVGRKTGLMVKDTGRRDSAGLEDMDAFFSPAVEKSPRKGGVSPRGKSLPYKTKFQRAIQSDDSVPMSGTSSSIKDPKQVLASRKSLLAQHRTPQKTHLKSPAVRIQTPKQSKLDSPSRVRRMMSFAELDADFDDEILNTGKRDDVTFESPTEIARPAKRKGLAQQRGRKPVEPVEEDEIVEEEETYDDFRFGGGDGGFADESYEHDEPVENLLHGDGDNLEENFEDDAEEVEMVEEEDDIYGTQEPSPPAHRGRGRPKGSSQKQAKKAPSRQRTKLTSTQPAPKRARTTSSASRSPKILQRKEIPHRADVSTLDGETRRSKRIRVPPLAHWKGERIVYELEGRRASGPALPKIKEIVRIDTPPHPPPRHATRKRKSRAPESDSEDDESDAGEVYATIKAYGDDSLIDDYKIAVSKSAINPQPLQGSKVRLEKIFQDGAYMASGILDILVGGAKGIKPTRHSYMSFAVMTGKVEVKVNRTAFIIGKGGVFVVPRGNFYSIKNVGQKDCRLFFSQAVEEGGPPVEQRHEDE